jgi:hypothetical protein
MKGWESLERVSERSMREGGGGSGEGGKGGEREGGEERKGERARALEFFDGVAPVVVVIYSCILGQ